MTFCDLTAILFFYQNPFYKKAVKDYLKNRKIDKGNFFERIQYLKRHGYIKTFFKNKEKYFELTTKGKERAIKLSMENLKIKKPKTWDKKWRIVIFDVPEKMHVQRDFLRSRLNSLGFLQIQKSVYAFPFECTREIEFISKKLRIESFVSIMIAEIMQGEEQIIETFIGRNLLNKTDIKT